MDLYTRYTTFIDQIIDAEDFENFKTAPDYSYMLEHPSDSQFPMAVSQLNLILKLGVNLDDVKEFSSKNDSIGGPEVCNIGHDVRSSCASMRYITHSVLAIIHFLQFSNEIDIVEVGGGYGGLALAFHFFAPKMGLKIKSYTIIDLPSPLKLQAKYLEKMGLANIGFSDASIYGWELPEGAFLVSNYAFSEFSEGIRTCYEKVLFPKLRHGYMLWNNIPLYNFGFDYKAVPEDEITDASEGNFHVMF